MIVIAVLLLAAVAAVTVGVIVGAEEDAVFDIFDETVSASGLELLAVGAACGVAVVVSAWLLQVGMRRSTLRRREMRAMRAALEAERERGRPATPDSSTVETSTDEPVTTESPSKP